MRCLAELDPVEIRVIGVLLEKEQTTPEYYPMTPNAIRAACNQKTNRFPVMNLSEAEVERVLENLDADLLVARAGGARTDHWKHRVDVVWKLNRRTQALLTLLLLRGPQTPGELRARSDRMHPFASVAEVDAALAELESLAEPLARELARRPGQKETRWGAANWAETGAEPLGQTSEEASALERRVASLEETVQRLERELNQLKRPGSG
jgi:hypothetical protein